MRNYTRRNFFRVLGATAFAGSSVVEAAAYQAVAVTVRNRWTFSVAVTLGGAGVVTVSKTLSPGEVWVARTTSNALNGLLTVTAQGQSRQARPWWGESRTIVADGRSFKIVKP